MATILDSLHYLQVPPLSQRYVNTLQVNTGCWNKDYLFIVDSYQPRKLLLRFVQKPCQCCWTNYNTGEANIGTIPFHTRLYNLKNQAKFCSGSICQSMVPVSAAYALSGESIHLFNNQITCLELVLYIQLVHLLKQVLLCRRNNELI